MNWKLLLAPLLVLAASCLTNNPINFGDSPTGPGGLPPADPTTVTSVEIFPGSKRAINGTEITFHIVTRIGAIEVLANFTPTTTDSDVASVLTADQNERTALVRINGVGDTEFVVRSGNVEARVPVTGVAASP